MPLVILSLLVGANSAWGVGGDLVWEKDIHYLPTYPVLDREELAVSSSVCIIAGVAKKDDTEPYPPNNAMGFIKAYDTASGTPKWERTFLLDNLHQLWVYKILINGNIAYIYTYNYSQRKYTLGAYDAITGNPLWEKVMDFQIATQVHPYPVMTVAGNRVIGYYDGVLRAYQAQNLNSPATASLLLLDK